jgi:hypothetical protein
MGAASFLFFFWMLVMSPQDRRHFRYALLVLFAISILSLSAFSAFLYVYLDKTSNQADFEEFILEMNARNGTAIFVDTSKAPSSSQGVMGTCAEAVARQIAGKNESVYIYTMDTTGCTRQAFSDANASEVSISRSACNSALNNSNVAVILNYSSKVAPPRFSIIYRNRAEIAGDYSYYNFCPLQEIFG